MRWWFEFGTLSKIFTLILWESIQNHMSPTSKESKVCRSLDRGEICGWIWLSGVLGCFTSYSWSIQRLLGIDGVCRWRVTNCFQYHLLFERPSLWDHASSSHLNIIGLRAKVEFVKTPWTNKHVKLVSFFNMFFNDDWISGFDKGTSATRPCFFWLVELVRYLKKPMSGTNP